jgi:tRNA-2-methylthio-N6-dimethylallyladenosine synthase/ribosomal protein S12 methylthiotransferase
MLGALPGGAVLVEAPAQAELALVNTCGFIQPAVEESVGTILDLAAQIAELPAKSRPKLVVAGCLVARYGDELKAELPEVDFWTLPARLDAWPEEVAALLERAPTPAGRRLSTPPSYAYLKIGEGCNHRCAYCTIPSIRGRLRSEPTDALVEEAKRLLAQGPPELVLVAQDLTAYGRDFEPSLRPDALIRLLDKLLPLDGLQWLRLLYLYPTGVTKELLRFLQGAGPRFLPYFDIPFQHTHPSALKAMGRPKSMEAERILDLVREHFPHAALRTSFIVGHPGETEEQFQSLVKFVESQRLQHVGVFPFYQEEGTVSATLKKQVGKKKKEARRDELMGIQAEISAELLAELVGETMPVLVDQASPEWPGLFVGRVWLQAPEADGVAYVSAPDGAKPITPGRFVEAMIEEAKNYDLVALA